MIYEILNDDGEVINTIIADEAFVEKKHHGHYRLVGPEPIVSIPPEKMEEEKIADATAAAIAKLIADGILKQV